MELETELKIAFEMKYLEDAEHQRCMEISSEISKMMNSLINKLEKKCQ